jgi:hypothetical protein
MSTEPSGKPDAWKLARPVWGWGRGETPRPTPHRQNFNDPGDAHELTFSCYRGYRFMRAERICQWLARSINIARVGLETDVWAFVFMPEHVQ